MTPNHHKILGSRLHRLAVKWGRNPSRAPSNAADRWAAINAIGGRKRTINGSQSKARIIAAVQLAAADVTATRDPRQQAAKLKAIQPIQVRLNNRIAAIVRPIVEDNCRVDAAGSVLIFAQSVRASASTNQSQDWNYYAKSYGHPKTITTTTISVPGGYLRAVHKRGLWVVGGLVTLSAGTAHTVDGVTVQSAAWLVQSRGYSLTVNHGYIATVGAYSYHGKTAKAAIRGVVKKARLAGASALTIDDIKRADQTIAVSVNHAKQAGACQDGIDAWMALVGIDGTSAPLSVVLAAYRAHPRSEALAAMAGAVATNQPTEATL